MSRMNYEFHVETLMNKKFCVASWHAKTAQQAVDHVREHFGPESRYSKEGADFAMTKDDVVTSCKKITTTHCDFE